MKRLELKRILALVLACVILITDQGVSYAAENLEKFTEENHVLDENQTEEKEESPNVDTEGEVSEGETGNIEEEESPDPEADGSDRETEIPGMDQEISDPETKEPDSETEISDMETEVPDPEKNPEDPAELTEPGLTEENGENPDGDAAEPEDPEPVDPAEEDSIDVGEQKENEIPDTLPAEAAEDAALQPEDRPEEKKVIEETWTPESVEELFEKDEWNFPQELLFEETEEEREVSYGALLADGLEKEIYAQLTGHFSVAQEDEGDYNGQLHFDLGEFDLADTDAAEEEIRERTAEWKKAFQNALDAFWFDHVDAVWLAREDSELKIVCMEEETEDKSHWSADAVWNLVCKYDEEKADSMTEDMETFLEEYEERTQSLKEEMEAVSGESGEEKLDTCIETAYQYLLEQTVHMLENQPEEDTEAEEGEEKEEQEDHASEAYGVFSWDEEAQPYNEEGVARAFKRLCEKAEIPCVVVRMPVEDEVFRTWTYICPNGEDWYTVDLWKHACEEEFQETEALYLFPEWEAMEPVAAEEILLMTAVEEVAEKKAAAAQTAEVPITSTLAYQTVEYSGAIKKPGVTVKKGDLVLKSGKDYSVQYRNNTDIGTASVKITGLGAYSTYSETKTFQITARDLGKAYTGKTVTVEYPVRTAATGNAVMVVPYSVKWGNTVLVRNRDYRVRYKNAGGSSLSFVKSAGTYYMVLEGMDNYKGSISLKFQVTNDTSMNDVTVSTVTAKTYTGSAIKPSIRLTNSKTKTVLKAGTHYKVSYTNNTNAGTATIIIDAIDGKGYAGRKKITFVINRHSVTASDIKISGLKSTYSYTGTKIQPALTVKCGSRTLKPGTDYKISYSSNVNPGTAKIVLTGIGNYSGSKTLTFKITGKISAECVKFTDLWSYTGKTLSIAPSSVTVGGRKLTKGTDYTISYQNASGKTVTTIKNVGKYKLVIKGKGKYTGTVILPFEVTKDILLSKMSISAIPAQTYTGAACKPKVTIQNKLTGTTKTLKEGVHYTLSYSNNVKTGKGQVTITCKKGSGYAGTKTLTFTIQRRSVASKDIQAVLTDGVSEFAYVEGKTYTPGITVKYGKTVLKKGTDYTVTYQNNQKMGIAAAVVTGIGNYSGTTKVPFTILGEPFDENVQWELPAKPVVYTGKSVVPDITVTDDGTKLKKGTDYQIFCSNNVKVGTASFRIRGIGNYSGELTGTFRIEPADIGTCSAEYVDYWHCTGEAIRALPEAVYFGSQKLVYGTDYEVGWEKLETEQTNGAETAPDTETDPAEETTDDRENGTETGAETNSGDGGEAVQENPVGIKAEAGAEESETETETGDSENPAKMISNAEEDSAAGIDGMPLDETEPGTDTGTKSGTPAEETDADAETGFDTETKQPETAEGEGRGTDTVIDPGTYKMIVTGIGNFQGTLESTFEVTELSLIREMAYENIAAQTYTGKAVVPKPVIRDGAGNLLKEGVHYRTEYANNIKTGKATITVRGIEESGYAGICRKTFDIKACSITSSEISYSSVKASYTYTGKAIAPTVTLTRKGEKLKSGTDYQISYSSNKNAGTAKITIKGIGGYSGSKSFTFKITRKALSKGDLKLAYTKTTYDGTNRQPAVTLTYNGITFKKNTDFKVSYANCRKSGTGTVTIQGINNFSGTVKLTYTISRASIASASVSLTDLWSYTGKTVSVLPGKVKVGSNELVKGTDYTVSYRNSAGKTISAGSVKGTGNYQIVLKGIGNYSGTITKTFRITKNKLMRKMTVQTIPAQTYTGDAIKPKIVVTEGSGKKKVTLKQNVHYKVTYVNNKLPGTATVRIEGIPKGGYEGTKTITFKIAKKSLSAKDIKVVFTGGKSEFKYTGKTQTPSVKVTFGKKTLVQGVDYKVTYLNNKAMGTAKVRLTGLGNYSGTRDVPFVILGDPLSTKNIRMVLSYLEADYTGKALTPKVSVWDDGVKLTEKKDYTVSYQNNINAGTATVKIKGIGKYSGYLSKSFKILPIDINRLSIGKPANFSYMKASNVDVRIKSGSVTLKKGKDYTITYKDGVQIGTNTITIKGIGNYKGSKNQSLKVSFNDSDKVTIKSCTAAGYDSGSGKLTIQLNTSSGSTLKKLNSPFYILRLDGYGKTVLGKITGRADSSSGITVSGQLSSSDNFRSAMMSKYALAIKVGNTYQQISKNALYIENPEVTACMTYPYNGYYEPRGKVTSKKGLQGASEDYMEDLGVQHVLLNVDIATLVSPKARAGYVSYSYKGKTYYFQDMIALVRTVTFLNGWNNDNPFGWHRRSVTLNLLLSWKDELSYLIHPAARRRGAAPYYALNMQEKKARETFEALFCYMGEKLGEDRMWCVCNWVLGNEVNCCQAWNYSGGLSLQDCVANYAEGVQILYQGIKRTASTSRIFISLDHSWGASNSGHSGKAYLDAFASYMNKTAPSVQWNVDYHPYSQPLNRLDFWKDGGNTTGSSGTAYISMKNIGVLTNYLGTLESKYGKPKGSIRVILGEQGFSAVEGDTRAEKLQAAALGYGYYIALFNSRVDAYIIRAYLDDPAETRAGLYLGLMSASHRKKLAYDMYKYVDTERSGEYMKKYLSTVGLSSWKAGIPNFDASKLNAGDF